MIARPTLAAVIATSSLVVSSALAQRNAFWCGSWLISKRMAEG